MLLHVVDEDPLRIDATVACSMSMIMRVPLYLSSRWGVWMRINSLVFIGQIDVFLKDRSPRCACSC